MILLSSTFFAFMFLFWVVGGWDWSWTFSILRLEHPAGWICAHYKSHYYYYYFHENKLGMFIFHFSNKTKCLKQRLWLYHHQLLFWPYEDDANHPDKNCQVGVWSPSKSSNLTDWRLRPTLLLLRKQCFWLAATTITDDYTKTNADQEVFYLEMVAERGWILIGLSWGRVIES